MNHLRLAFLRARTLAPFIRSRLGRWIATALVVAAICSVESPTFSQTCAPNCAGMACGPDGCGGSCGTCKRGDTCSPSGQCISGCAANNNGMPCTPTEQRFLNKSVDCYNCLVNTGC